MSVCKTAPESELFDIISGIDTTFKRNNFVNITNIRTYNQFLFPFFERLIVQQNNILCPKDDHQSQKLLFSSHS